LLIRSLLVSFCAYKGTVPYQSSAQLSCREEVGVSWLRDHYITLYYLGPESPRLITITGPSPRCRRTIV
jgi:hypothetical protein